MSPFVATMPSRPASSNTTSSLPAARAPVKKLLKDLHFDDKNPRFGPDDGSLNTETKILNRIADVHGVNDLLSSLAVNGFSDAEPLIGLRRKDGNVIIKEGNRRLAACMILSGDPRSKGQEKRAQRFHAIRRRHGNKSVDPVPVILFDSNEMHLILPYLGVKHIVGAEEWSAWAKAAWADELLTQHDIDLSTALEMVGDEQGQIPRSLASYYFVQQLIDEGRFDPKDSVKRGGGGSDFPFSLIYNGLGYTNIRSWVGLPSSTEPVRDPIPQDKLGEAADFMDFVCGSRSRNFDPVVKDNRQFARLNEIAANKASVTAVKQGRMTLEQAAKRLEPVSDQLLEGLLEVRHSLEEMIAVASGGQMTREESEEVEPEARGVVYLSNRLYKTLQSLDQLELAIPESPTKKVVRKRSRPASRK